MFFSPASSERCLIETNLRRGMRLFAYTDLNSVCYNSITEQGQMFWIAAVTRAVWKPV